MADDIPTAATGSAPNGAAPAGTPAGAEPAVTPAAAAAALAGTQRVVWRALPEEPAKPDHYIGTFSDKDAATLVDQLNGLHAGRRVYRAVALAAVAAPA